MNTIELLHTRHTKQNFGRMRSVLACAAQDAGRYIVTKVLVEAEPDGIAMVATDGRRLRRDRFALEAKAGLYDIKVNSVKTIFLTQCEEELTFPDYRPVIPNRTADSAYALRGNGKAFVLRATAGLGCYVDPKLVELSDVAGVTLFIQKSDPATGPVLVRNADTTFVIMPLRLDQPWIAQLQAILTERTVEALRRAEAKAAAA